MSEFLSPGIFIEEVSNAPQTVDSVGTSTMAIVGWTPMGPTDEATLVTGPSSYARTFGGDTIDSYVPLSVSAFFTNGGSRAYVVRVVPSDAEVASYGIAGTITGELLGAVNHDDTTPVVITDTLLFPAATAGSVVVSWTKVAAAVVSENPVMAPAEDGIVLGPFTCTLAGDPLTDDTITLDWSTVGPVTHTATLTKTTGTEVQAGADTALVSAWTVDRETGAVSVTFTTAPIADTIRFSYKPVGAAATVTDDGAGLFTGVGIAGTVDYTTGEITITFTGAAIVPYNGNQLTVAYTGTAWTISAISAGEWGNDVRITLSGNENFYVYGSAEVDGAGTYTKFDVTVSKLNSDGVYEVKETYEELVMDDPSDAMYIADVINNGSDLISITDTGFGSAPTTFYGTAYTAEVLGAGNGSTKAFTDTLSNIPVSKTSLVITYTVGASDFEATANSAGVITGTHIDATKTNTVNWTTGVVVLNFSTAPDNATNITADYIKMPTTASVSYDLVGGEDGDVASISSTDVSNASALQADKLGMYALSRVDEMMQLVIPDFAGDTTVQGEMIDYAEARRDIFCILTTPRGYDAQDAVDFVRITMGRKSKYAAMYWPWVKMTNPLASNQTLTVPVVAHVAGIYARTDNSRNVGKAPAGTIDGALRGITGLERNPDLGERNTVSPARINSLINTPQTGMAVWGARTMSASNDALKYVNAVRLFIFVEKSVFNATHGYVFESINSNLYSQIKGQLESFLLNLYNTGHFAGKTPQQAFSVVCDASNNPPEVVNQGMVVVDIAIAPNRPGEFIRFRFSQKTLS